MRMVFIIIFVYLIASFFLQEYRVMSLADQVRALENEAARLRSANAQVTEDIQYAQTDAYIEQVARGELGLIWPHEIPYAPPRATGGPASFAP